MNIAVTGDSGFIGSYLTKVLEQHGHAVSGIDINPVKKYPVRYPFVTGDILDRDALEQLPNPIDCIIHLAAAHKDFGITKEGYYAVNVDGMKSLLQFAADRGITRFIFYSTVAVYGDNQPSTEESSPSPINHYGGSKLEAEKLLHQWSEEDPSRQVIIIRPSVVFGPLNVANIFKLIKQVCDGKFLWVGEGNNVKSIAYVENLVDATLFLLAKFQPGCSTFNYSDEPHLTTKDLVGTISRISGKKVSSFHIPLALALFGAKVIDLAGRITGIDFPITAARIKKFNTSTEHRSSKIRDIGFRPAHTIEEGLRKNIEWYFANNKNTSLNAEAGGE